MLLESVLQAQRVRLAAWGRPVQVRRVRRVQPVKSVSPVRLVSVQGHKGRPAIPVRQEHRAVQDRLELLDQLERLEQLELQVFKALREEPDRQVTLDLLVHQVRRVQRVLQARLEA